LLVCSAPVTHPEGWGVHNDPKWVQALVRKLGGGSQTGLSFNHLHGDEEASTSHQAQQQEEVVSPITSQLKY
jgi:hypothetical protein